MADWIIGVLNSIIKGLASVLGWFVNLLPASPFEILDNSPIGQYLPVINWFVPVQSIVNTLTAWITAIATYYLVQIILRWAKAIE